MAQVTLEFLEECNDFLPPARHGRQRYAVAERQSVKDVIEAQGVPHPEVALILANGAAVPFGYLVQDGDEVVVYPAWSELALPAPPLRARPEPRFVLDVHLGRLAEFLRLLGFDTLYRNDYDDPELAQIAGAELRILLTRDLGLLKRGRVVYGAYVRTTDPQAQIVEIIRRFALWDALAPLTRCSRCNGLLEPATPAEVANQLLPQTRADHTEFRRCRQCGQVYWPGSHVGRLTEFIAGVRAQQPGARTS